MLEFVRAHGSPLQAVERELADLNGIQVRGAKLGTEPFEELQAAVVSALMTLDDNDLAGYPDTADEDEDPDGTRTWGRWYARRRARRLAAAASLDWDSAQAAADHTKADHTRAPA